MSDIIVTPIWHNNGMRVDVGKQYLAVLSFGNVVWLGPRDWRANFEVERGPLLDMVRAAVTEMRRRLKRGRRSKA